MNDNIYFDQHFDMEAVKLVPGESFATPDPKLIVTVVSAGVAACVNDRVNGIGGMIHFLLPNAGETQHASEDMVSNGTRALANLVDRLMELGAQRHHLQAKVFGGASLLNSLQAANAGAFTNRFIHEYLSAEEIPIVAKDVLHIYPRKVYFFPGNGRTLVKTLRQLKNETIMAREQAYTNSLFSETAPGNPSA
jgi:chemotaxis protein CheD